MYAHSGSFIGANSSQYFNFWMPPFAAYSPPPRNPSFGFQLKYVSQDDPKPDYVILYQFEPNFNLTTVISQPTTPVTQVVPHLPEIDSLDFPQELPIYGLYA